MLGPACIYQIKTASSITATSTTPSSTMWQPARHQLRRLGGRRASSPHATTSASIGYHAKKLRHTLTPAVRPATGSPSPPIKRSRCRDRRIGDHAKQLRHSLTPARRSTARSPSPPTEFGTVWEACSCTCPRAASSPAASTSTATSPFTWRRASSSLAQW